MKKITLILSLLISAYGFAQNVSTGVVEFTSDFSVKFDVNGTTDIVTMTMVGPDGVWFGVALGANAMLNVNSGGGDVIMSHGSNGSLTDRNLHQTQKFH